VVYFTAFFKVKPISMGNKNGRGELYAYAVHTALPLTVMLVLCWQVVPVTPPTRVLDRHLLCERESSNVRCAIASNVMRCASKRV